MDLETAPNKKHRVVEFPLEGKATDKQLPVSMKGPLENTDSEDDSSHRKCKKVKNTVRNGKGKKARVDEKKFEIKNPATDSPAAAKISNADAKKNVRAILSEDNLSRQKPKKLKKTVRHEYGGAPPSVSVDSKKFETKKSATDAPAIGVKETASEDERPREKNMKKAAPAQPPSKLIDRKKFDIELTKTDTTVVNCHSYAESSFMIPRKRKNVADSPQALKTSSLINSSSVDPLDSRIPRKLLRTFSHAGPNETKFPVDSPPVGLSSISSRDITQSRPRSLHHEQPKNERHITSRDQAYGTSSLQHQIRQYSHPLRDNQSYVPRFGSPNKTTFCHDDHNHWRREANSALPRPTTAESNGENQYQPNVSTHLPPK
jgi:hypothetical protein